MQCPECQTENPPRELICIACGTQIGKQCPVCGTANPNDEECCSQCGHDLGVWRPSIGNSVAPLANRDAEMAAIEKALSRATQGYGQVVGVLGMPGVGSSRLCRELMARCRSGGMPVYELACPFYGKSVPFLAVRELLRSMFGFHPDDSTDTAADRVTSALRVLSPEGGRWIPFAQAFLGVGDPENPPPEMELEARREMLSELATRFVLARAEAESVVLLIDDAQWLDPDSDAILARIVEGMAQTRLLLLLTLRPGYHASWTGKAYYHQLALRPLAREAGEETLRSLLGEDPSLSDGIGVLVERTRGYPYFIEETVRLLAMNHTLVGKAGEYRLAHPIERHDVPATVESVVAARIESLGELARRVLYAASIIAGRVPTTVLRRVADI